VSKALIAALAAAFALTTGGVNGFVYCADNFANRDATGFYLTDNRRLDHVRWKPDHFCAGERTAVPDRKAKFLTL
jgi:hypothetical protein